MRAATTSSTHGKVTGKRRGEDFSCIPGEVGAKRCDRGGGRLDQIVRREKRSVVAPKERGRKVGRKEKGDDKCIMITLGTRDERGIHFEVELAAVGEDVVNARVRIDTDVVEGEILAGGTEEGGIIEGAKARLKEMPGREVRRGERGGTVLDWIRIHVPVTGEEIEGGEVRGVLDEVVEELVTRGPFCGSIYVSDGEDPPPVTKSG
jgi:hypothetical protein